MIRRLIIASLLTLPLAAQQDSVDHLRFTNGDQLQGHFGGISDTGKIFWERPDIATPIELQQEKVRQIVLHGASPASPMANPCHVTLVNGDRIPGKVVAADENEYTIESTAAGVLTLPRDIIATVAPNPFGGRLLYAGPFEEKGWNIARGENTGEVQDPFAGNAPLLPDPTNKKDANAKKEEPKAAWVHAGTAWYSRSGGDAITYDANMPDRSLLRFKLGWRSRPSFAVAFHADLAKPPAPKKEGEEGDENRGSFGGPSQFTRLFGNAYVLNFNPGYVRLQRTWYDEDGQPKITGVRVGSTSIRLPDTGEALFEIRADRKEGCIAVYIDGEFALQWYTAEENEREEAPSEKSYKAPGGAFGFQVQGGASQVKISDIVVAEWNGMTDSARSMESEKQDIVLLTNGTDRFSGTVRGIQDGVVEIDSKYAGMKIPVAEVAEIRFAKSGRRKIEEAPAAEISVHLQPVGKISGKPVVAADGRIELENRLAGKIDLDLAPAVVLEFQSSGGFLDAWDDDL